MQKYYKLKDQRFLSTPSARRATQDQIHHLWRGGHFYPRPPRGGRPSQPSFRIHLTPFLSTPSARRATKSKRTARIFTPISIHALREEGDRNAKGQQTVHFIFLSTPSARRATVDTAGGVQITTRFLSTPSARRATPASMACSLLRPYFYPRPPRGGRPRAQRKRPDMRNFYPRPPRGGRRFANAIEMELIHFYPRPPRGGRRGHSVCGILFRQISIHALREEGDLTGLVGVDIVPNFYPRPPRGGRPSEFFYSKPFA